MRAGSTITIARRAGPMAVGILLAAIGLCLCPHRARAQSMIVKVETPQATLIPTAQDYANDYVEATGAAGIRIKVKTSNRTGLILKARSSGTGNSIRLGDLLVRTLTPAGSGGMALSAWTAVRLTDLNLWSVAVGSNQFIDVSADTRVINIGFYGDNVSAGFTQYSHTVVFTAVTP